MKYNHKFKKKFGQNFLNDKNILEKIIEVSDIEDDTLVIEVGPGSGNLTEKIKQHAQNVIAYEIDTDLKNILMDKFSNTNVDIIWDDFLKRDINNDISKYSYKHLYVVSNVPYYITTPIIEKLIESNILIDKIIIMVQKEVGERFSAKVGNKDYGSITVFLNYFFDIKKEFVVSRNAFTPKPNVDSVVISLTSKKDKLSVKDEKVFFKLIRDSFKFKRKTLKNNLRDYDLNLIEEVLKKYNKDLTTRAENITVEEFVEISNAIT